MVTFSHVFVVKRTRVGNRLENFVEFVDPFSLGRSNDHSPLGIESQHEANGQMMEQTSKAAVVLERTSENSVQMAFGVL